MSFKQYLIKERLKENTIREHLQNIHYLHKWAKQEEMTHIEQLTHIELLAYINYEKQRKISVATINLRINSIRKYYEYLKEEGYTLQNPTRKLSIKGTVKKVVENPLSYKELEQLYYHYEEYRKQLPAREKERQEKTTLQNQVITSLMIWQGIHSGELRGLEKRHVDVQKGTIYIPSTSRSKSRTIRLANAQILLFYQYLQSLPAKQEYLFIHKNTHDLVARITKELKGVQPKIRNAQHIRSSVILHWLKIYGKREVQEMIGHKWISSTEHYEQQEIDGLTDLLKKHHPFG